MTKTDISKPGSSAGDSAAGVSTECNDPVMVSNVNGVNLAQDNRCSMYDVL